MKIYRVSGALGRKKNFPYRVNEFEAEEKPKTYKLPYEQKNIKKNKIGTADTMTYNNSPLSPITFYVWVTSKDDIPAAVTMITKEIETRVHELRNACNDLVNNLNPDPIIKFREEY